MWTTRPGEGPPLSRRISSVLSGAGWGFALGGLISMTLLVLPATPAMAGVSCTSVSYDTVVRYEANGRGVKVTSPGMAVYNGSVECARLSSINVYNTAVSRGVAVGWFEDPVNFCDLWGPTTGSNPVLVAMSFEANDYSWLHSPPTVSVGTDTFLVNDANQDGRWTYGHNGSNVWTSPNLTPFVTGLIYSYGSRGSTGDTSHSDFEGMLRMNSGQNWVAPTIVYEAGEQASNDPGARPCIYSDVHTAVKLNGTPC